MASKRSDIARWGPRLKVQLLGIVVFNGYFWHGPGKRLCFPVLNCYACPAATTACPIGSLSAFATVRMFPYYILGLLGVAGVALGRAFCGWACPFGWLQDLLYRIPSPKWRLPRPFNLVKYALLVGLVFALPLIDGPLSAGVGADTVVREAGQTRNFCSLVCPAGTLEAGLPSLIYSAPLRQAATWRTYSKIGILFAFLLLMVFSRRSFCRSACPLGALMAFFSPVALTRLRTDPTKCTRCMRCVRVCPTHCRTVPKEAGGRETTSECILCLDCVRSCPEAGALSARIGGRTVAVSRGTRNA